MRFFQVGAPTAAIAWTRTTTKYGTTEKKITHIIDESREKGWGGFVNTDCGKWIRPDWLTQDRPDGTRLCKLCAKKEATMKFRNP